MKIKLLKDGLVEPLKWPKKKGDIVNVNPAYVQRNIDSGLAELYTEDPPTGDGVTLVIQGSGHNHTARTPQTTDNDPPDMETKADD